VTTSWQAVESWAVTEPEWISIAAAQRLAGCSEPTVLKALANGELQQRTGLPRGVPSINRKSAESWAATWRAAADARAARRAVLQSHRPRSAPPDDGYEWLSTKEAAPIVNRSLAWLVDRAARDLVPHERRGNRLWWRRDQVEAMGSVRAPRETAE
jgi:hypothetical protein